MHMTHGLRPANEAFFIEIQNFWAWADKLGKLILDRPDSREFGVFSGKTISTSTHFGLFNIISKKSKPILI